MNKTQLAQELSEKISGISRAQAERFLDEMTKLITQKLIAGDEVVFSGFGAFSSKKRKGRVGVNPRDTKQSIQIPSVKVAKFKPGKNLKDSLKKSDRAPSNAPAPTAPIEPEHQV